MKNRYLTSAAVLVALLASALVGGQAHAAAPGEGEVTLEQLAAQHAVLEGKVDNHFALTNAKFDKLEGKVDNNFMLLNTKIDGNAETLNAKIDGNTAALSAKIDALMWGLAAGFGFLSLVILFRRDGSARQERELRQLVQEMVRDTLARERGEERRHAADSESGGKGKRAA